MPDAEKVEILKNDKSANIDDEFIWYTGGWTASKSAWLFKELGTEVDEYTTNIKVNDLLFLRDIALNLMSCGLYNMAKEYEQTDIEFSEVLDGTNGNWKADNLIFDLNKYNDIVEPKIAEAIRTADLKYAAQLRKDTLKQTARFDRMLNNACKDHTQWISYLRNNSWAITDLVDNLVPAIVAVADNFGNDCVIQFYE